MLTCINLCSLVPDLKCCFEILGFDIMLDERLKPWLLEVNSSPAMSMETDIDHLVKPALIRDVLGLCNFEQYHAWLERQKTSKTTKGSNIHQNFFSKRTTASNKREESVTGPSSANIHHAKKNMLLRDKYESRTNMKGEKASV